MIIVNTSNEELLKSVKDDMERLQKEAQDALKANEKEAKEIEKNHGKDTQGVKKVVSKDALKNLKSMQLSESLFDDADEGSYHSDAIDVCDAFRNGDMSLDELIDELTFIKDRMDNGVERVKYDLPGFDEVQGMLDKLTIYGESLNEDLSPKGKKLIAELKQELGPELQRKVVALMKDLQTSLTQNKGTEEKQTNESLTESTWSVYYVDDDPQEGTLFTEEEDAKKFQTEMGEDWKVTKLEEAVKRYSDKTPVEDRKYWYFTKHGIGPGVWPKDLHLVDSVEDDNWGTYICLDGVCNKDELDKYELVEKKPPEGLK